jgi:hypothetical protein
MFRADMFSEERAEAEVSWVGGKANTAKEP